MNSVLRMRGGVYALLVPFVVMLVGLLVLAVMGLAIPEAFWPMVLIGLLTGLALARSPHAYAQALIAGIASPVLAVILLAWFLAGVFARLLGQTGVMEALVWLSAQVGLTAAWFPLVTFLAASLFSLCTGTSIGTILTVTPLLFPAGFAVGADPLLLVGAIIGGAYVGDNLAPVSDTVIVSAYSQGTTIREVVRTRVKYAAVAGAATIAVYVAVALTTTGGTTTGTVQGSPKGLIMLAAPALLVALMLAKAHFVNALMISTASGILLALATGLLPPSRLLHVDADQGLVTGVVVEGISGFLGVAVFTILLFALIGTFHAGGLIDTLVHHTRRHATTPTRAEMSMYGLTLAVNALTTAGTPAMVMLGPYVRRLGHHARIARHRRANLLEAGSTTIIGFLPYSVAVLLPFALVRDTVADADLTTFDPVHLIPYVIYCWALMLVFAVAVLTGWGRTPQPDHDWHHETHELTTPTQPTTDQDTTHTNPETRTSTV